MDVVRNYGPLLLRGELDLAQFDATINRLFRQQGPKIIYSNGTTESAEPEPLRLPVHSFVGGTLRCDVIHRSAICEFAAE